MKKKLCSESICAVGIDVAKATLSVCCRSVSGEETALSLRNIETDIKNKLIKQLSGFNGKVVMESTGHYHWLVAILLCEAGIDVRVVNPILAKQYTSSNIRKVKTDPADASGLARMAALADNLPAQFTTSRQILILRKKLSLISSLSKQLVALKANLKHLEEVHDIFDTAVSPVEMDMQTCVASLTRTLKHLEEEFVKEANAHEGDKTQASLLETIPGVSTFTAHLVLHWCVCSQDITAKSWIGFAGLDISSRESGTWKGRCRLTKRGNPYLRRRLYNAAWGAVRNNEQFKEYYDELRNDGHPYVEALLIIARKLIRIMFQVLKTSTAYDPKKFQSKTKLNPQTI